MIVKSRVTTLSQPLVLINVYVAVLFDEVYVFPSIHMRLSHTKRTSVPKEVLQTQVAGIALRLKASNSTSPLEN